MRTGPSGLFNAILLEAILAQRKRMVRIAAVRVKVRMNAHDSCGLITRVAHVG